MGAQKNDLVSHVHNYSPDILYFSYLLMKFSCILKMYIVKIMLLWAYVYYNDNS